MKKYFFALLAGTGLFLLQSALAHEFWLKPQRFLLKVGERVPIRLQVGENFTGEAVDVRKARIIQFIHHSKVGAQSVKDQVREGENGGVTIHFPTEGTHLLSYRSTAKFIELPADKFNAYLQEDGLDNVLEARRQSGQGSKAGRELYSRCVKSLLQVGSTTDETFQLSTGDRLEITPEQNPYALANGDSLSVQIRFDGQPLEKALVRVWNKSTGTLRVDTLRSNSTGRIAFPLTRKGIWMVSLVRMIPYPDNRKADWQSFWGNLTFGFE